MALVMGLGLTSCMDDDWKAPLATLLLMATTRCRRKTLSLLLSSKKIMASQRT